MPITFRCACGKTLAAKDSLAGFTVTCPSCRQSQTVPSKANARIMRAKQAAAGITSNTSTTSPTKHATGILSFTVATTLCWAVSAIVLSVLKLAFPGFAILFSLLLLAATIGMLWLLGTVVVARKHVLGRGQVDLCWGLVQMIGWDPNVGILVLRNKQTRFHDDLLFDGGGIRIIYPILGDEVACRVPLEVQTLSFSDDNVLTREYLPLHIEGVIKWRICRIEAFYLLMSRDIRVSRDEDTGAPATTPGHAASRGDIAAETKTASAAKWLAYIAEEQTRAVVSRVSTGLLVAERVAASLPDQARQSLRGRVLNPVPMSPESTGDYRSATEGLATAILRAINPRVAEFGIEVIEVSLQEVGLPADLHAAAVEACTSSYIPTVSQNRGTGRKLELEAEAEVLGRDTVGAREVVGNAPAYALSDFLSNFLSSNKALGRVTESKPVRDDRDPRGR